MSNTSKKTVARTSAPVRARRPSAPAATTVIVDDHQVAALAYQYFVEGGCQHGHALEHWLRAESELRGR
jgi:hypothetical protein